MMLKRALGNCRTCHTGKTRGIMTDGSTRGTYSSRTTLMKQSPLSLNHALGMKEVLNAFAALLVLISSASRRQARISSPVSPNTSVSVF
jgi:hypothetical protein